MSEVKKEKTFTLNDLRVILSDEIEKLRAGTTSPANVNAVSNASGKILSTIKIELEVMKLLGGSAKRNSIAGLISEESEDKSRGGGSQA